MPSSSITRYTSNQSSISNFSFAARKFYFSFVEQNTRRAVGAFLSGKLKKLRKANIRLYKTLQNQSVRWTRQRTFYDKILQRRRHDSFPEESEPVDDFKRSLLLLLVDLKHRDEVLWAAGVDSLTSG